MKWNKVKNTFMFSKYVRSDNKYSIIAEDRTINNSLKCVFVVYDSNGQELEVFKKLKDAKETYLSK